MHFYIFFLILCICLFSLTVDGRKRRSNFGTTIQKSRRKRPSQRRREKSVVIRDPVSYDKESIVLT